MITYRVDIGLVVEEEVQVTPLSNLTSPDCLSETPDERNVRHLADVMCDAISHLWTRGPELCQRGKFPLVSCF